MLHFSSAQQSDSDNLTCLRNCAGQWGHRDCCDVRYVFRVELGAWGGWEGRYGAAEIILEICGWGVMRWTLFLSGLWSFLICGAVSVAAEALSCPLARQSSPCTVQYVHQLDLTPLWRYNKITPRLWMRILAYQSFGIFAQGLKMAAATSLGYPGI